MTEGSDVIIVVVMVMVVVVLDDQLSRVKFANGIYISVKLKEIRDVNMAPISLGTIASLSRDHLTNWIIIIALILDH